MNKNLFGLFILFLGGCISSPNFSDTPTLTFVGMTKNTMVQGDLNNDSIEVILEFSDGNGDIGSATNGSIPNLFVIDNRNGQIYDNIRLPMIPEEGSNNGVEGKIYLKVYNGCCTYTDRPNCTSRPDTTNVFTLDIYLRDRALNQSNTVKTDPVTLICQ